MFRKTPKTLQLNALTLTGKMFSENVFEFYEDKIAWHNSFRKQVTKCINESFFSPLYFANIGKPNAPLRVLVVMMIIKTDFCPVSLKKEPEKLTKLIV